MDLGIRVHFAPRGDSLSATIDIPVQNAFALPLRNVRWVAPACSFDLPAGPGLASFLGALQGDSITGSFTQSGMKGTFFLRPAREEKTAAGPPPPYSAEEVTFASNDALLAGTLTIPEGTPPFPALVMITGSGAQDRDETIFGFSPFKIIADHLTRGGIAVLRFDDRGVARSTGKFAEATTATFAADARAGMEFLANDPRIITSKIGLLGHSEGGIAGTMVASRHDDVAVLILIASPAIPGDSLINYQVAGAVRRGGGSEAEVNRVLGLQRQVYTAVKSGEGFERVEELLMEEGRASIARLPEAERGAVTDSVLRLRVKGQMTSVRSPWFREFISFDPAPALRKVACPVLALFGGVDQQVPPALNREPMERALRGEGRDATVRVIPEANHLFLHSTSGDPAEYATQRKEFVPEFLPLLGNWCRERLLR
jgi:pimeloyl-ACP methyl ester carboxylesterase